jgi:hypothetical protein
MTEPAEEHFFPIGNSLEVLGVDAETLLSMGIREFHTLCLSKGIEPQFTLNGVAPGLTIDFDTTRNEQTVS